MIQIKHSITGDVLFSSETNSLKIAVEAAVKPRGDLRDAYLGGAYLRGAYLRGADLRGADLGGAELRGAKISKDITIDKTPIQLFGLPYEVMIFDAHIKIGCELHSMAGWFSFSDDRIVKMDGKKALSFWRQWKEPLRAMCMADGRYEG